MSNPKTLRISARQLADAAYRALRVAGIPSGAAAEAARDAVELERLRGRGLEVLDRILETGGGSLLMSYESDGAGTSFDARGASALLLAGPLVALACELAPSPLTVHRLAHCAALEPALVRCAGAEHRRFLATGGDAPVLSVEPAQTTIGSGWSGAWGLPIDVRLAGDYSGTPPGAVPDGSSADRPLMVAAQRWERLIERAAAYLVDDSAKA